MTRSRRWRSVACSRPSPSCFSNMTSSAGSISRRVSRRSHRDRTAATPEGRRSQPAHRSTHW
jgi:hypothetical protein